MAYPRLFMCKLSATNKVPIGLPSVPSMAFHMFIYFVPFCFARKAFMSLFPSIILSLICQRDGLGFMET